MPPEGAMWLRRFDVRMCECVNVRMCECVNVCVNV